MSPSPVQSGRAGTTVRRVAAGGPAGPAAPPAPTGAGSASTPPVTGQPQPADGGGPAPGPVATLLDRGAAFAEAWAPTVARVLLGLVLLWFGYHELVSPLLWTGYVHVLPATSHVAEVLVLGHGWLLAMLAVAIIVGIAPRLSAAVAVLLLAEIVISLITTGGLSDLVLRDVGVLGLAIAITGSKRQRLLLRK